MKKTSDYLLKFNYQIKCAKDLMHSNCGVGEDSWECKEIESVHPKGNLSWIFIGRTDAEAEAPVLWSPDANSQLTGKDPDAGKDWEQEVKWMTETCMLDTGWMASLTQWTWVWVDSGSRWWTGRPGMLPFMGSQRVGHDWATELNNPTILGRKSY